MAPAVDLSSSSSTASGRTAQDERSRDEQDSLEEVACPCLNVRVKYTTPSTEAGAKVRLAENGVAVALPSLVGKELAQISTLGSSSLPCPALRCLHCSTSVYAVEKAASAGPTRSIGFRSASGSANASNVTSVTAPETRKPSPSARDVIVRPHDGFIYLLPGSIGAEEIKAVEADQAFSPIYGVSVSLASPPKPSSLLSEASSSLRPSFSQAQHRHSSYGQYTSASQYGLQGLPSHLIVSPGASPRNRSPSKSISANQTAWVTPSGTLSAALAGTSSSGSPAPSPLATQLDSAALESLRQWRSNAEQEIVQIVRAKRREFDELIKRAKIEGEAMLEKVRAAPAPVPVMPAEIRGRSSNGQGREGRSRDSSLAAPNRGAVDRSSSEAAIAATEASREASREASPTLSDEAFQRRPTQSSRNASAHNGGAGPQISSSLSALSASFAMRGRDATCAMDDWAQRRRLKERYPQGDHSVMTSAATSAANSYSDQGHLANKEEEEEEERRGRGRDRGTRAESPAKAVPTPMAAQSSTPVQDTGSAMVAPGTVSRPTMAPSSLNVKHFVKSPALTSIDVGATTDKDTPRPGGLLRGLASPSADIHLRPRNPPPSGAEPLKPATRKSRDAQSRAVNKEKGERGIGNGAGEKKVAFAETTDQAGSSRNYSDSEEEEVKELVDERKTAVFDIDEELDGEEEGSTLENPRPDAISGAAGSILDEELERDSTITERSEEAEDADEDDEDARSVLDQDDLGGVRASVGARQAGSFAALAEFGRSRGRGRAAKVASSIRDPSFDPASIRLDGRVVVPGDSSPKKRSGSRSREVSREALMTPSSDYDGETTSTKRRASDWDRRNTAIGYRSVIPDAELRLSGLLAPHAPSHRQLWIKERRKNDEKYIPAVDEGDDKVMSATDSSSVGIEDKQWCAWQQRAKQMEDVASKRHRELTGSDGPSGLLASSMPIDQVSRARGVSVPRPGQAIGSQGRSASTTVYDETSGFDREPKTSLPYQEHQMVPSLRKATRRQLGPTNSLLPSRSSHLPTIVDAEMGDDAAQSATHFEPGRSRSASKGGVTASRMASPDASSRAAGGAGGALPGSVMTKGFGSGSTNTTTSPRVVSLRSHASVAASKEHRDLSQGLGLGFGVGSAAPLLHASSGIATGHSSPESRSPSSRRSPRPPYIPPPPPASTSLVLQPNPLQKPAPLNLFTTAPDLRFAYNEEGEEEESDWSKVLDFMHRVERLKTNKRTGWLHHRVPLVESIADHMYRMGILAMLCPNSKVDLGKCVMLALVHDLAEAEVGDLTPLDRVSKEEKTRREGNAIAFLVHDLLGSSPAGLRIESLWHEYENRETLESLLVKDLDRFELILQAVEYEGRYDIVDLQPFFNCAGEITHPRIRTWALELAREREQMWRAKGEKWAYKQTVEGSVRGE